MIINRFYPIFKIVNIQSLLGVITSSTTRNAISLHISNIVIYSINPVVNVFSIAIISQNFLIWRFSAVMTWLMCNPTKIILRKIPIYFSSLRRVFSLCIQNIERGFSLRQTSSTRLSAPVSQVGSAYYFLVSAIALTQKIQYSFSYFRKFKNHQFPVAPSNPVNSRNHINTLKGDSLRLAMLLLGQHLHKSLGVMNKKFAYKYSCPSTYIIP